MIEQNVQVVRCTEKKIWVRLGSLTGCSVCDSGKGCGAGVFAKLLQRKPVVIELPRQAVEVKAGQMVTLAFPEQIYLKMVMFYYGWPLLAALAGAVIGHSLGIRWQVSDVLLDLLTLSAGILAGFLFLRTKKKQAYTETLLNGLTMATYQASHTPDICGGAADKPAQN